MLLYALLIPLLFLFIGVGIDLGWYFVKVSRLQNAADAAVIAGATKLIEENPEQKLTGYSKNVQLIDSFYGDNETGTDLDTEAGNEEAVTYALKNLSDDATFERVTNGDKVVAYTLKDKMGGYQRH